MRRICLPLILTALISLGSPVAGFQLTPLEEGRLAVELNTAGKTRDEAIAAARVQAVLGSVGRVFVTEHLVMADQLLKDYATNYASNFVRAVEVLDEQYAGGQSQIHARVFVDYDKLIRDLDEKKFLYKPQYKPRFSTFMSEVVDGELGNEGTARQALRDALEERGMKAAESELTTPPSNTDVTIDELLTDAALVSAQRAGVEIIVSGEVTTRKVDQRTLYYDEYWFFDSEMRAKLIRVDTGEILFEARAFGSASDRNSSQATRLAIERAAAGVAQQLQSQYIDFWPYVVQGKSDYEVLLTGVDEESLRIVRQNIERLGGGVKVDLKKKFDRTAVLSVVYKGTKTELIDNLNSCPYPTLYILNPNDEKKFEVQVSS